MNAEKTINIKCEANKYYKLDELNFFQGKLKSITEDNFKKLKQSIVKHGLPLAFHVWIDSKNKVWIVDGHHRYLALKGLIDEGYNVDTIPCNVVSAKSKKEAAQIVLISNSKYAEMSQESLADFMIDFELKIEDLDFLDIPSIDFDFGLEEKKEGLTADDSVPEVDQNIHGVKLGDIYKLGNHRLMCGDSTSIDAVKKLMDGQKADLAYCDPPYGADIVNKSGKLGGTKPFGNIGNMVGKAVKAGVYAPIIGDETTNTAKDSFSICSQLCKNLVFWGAQYYAEFLPPNSGWIVWDKQTDGSLGDGELAYSNIKKAIRIFSHKWSGMIKASEHGQKRVHPTQKPIALAEWCFENYGENNKNILDLFGGSGSTLIACEKTNRKCFMMELDPHYCSVIIERWQQFTGLKAVKAN